MEEIVTTKLNYETLESEPCGAKSKRVAEIQEEFLNRQKNSRGVLYLRKVWEVGTKPRRSPFTEAFRAARSRLRAK